MAEPGPAHLSRAVAPIVGDVVSRRATSGYLNRTPMSRAYHDALRRWERMERQRMASGLMGGVPRWSRSMNDHELAARLRIFRLERKGAWIDIRILCRLNGIYGDKISLLERRKAARANPGDRLLQWNYQAKRDRLADLLVRMVKAREAEIAISDLLTQRSRAEAAE